MEDGRWQANMSETRFCPPSVVRRPSTCRLLPVEKRIQRQGRRADGADPAAESGHAQRDRVARRRIVSSMRGSIRSAPAANSPPRMIMSGLTRLTRLASAVPM